MLKGHSNNPNNGFTVIELVIVILLLGIITASILPRFIQLSSSARIATLEGIAASMHTTINTIRSIAYINGIKAVGSNPGNQAAFLVTTEAGTSEIDWRNLCPESRAELGDALNMADHIKLQEAGNMQTITDNRYTRIGFDIQGLGPPTANGCYVTYDSFGLPECTVNIVSADC